MHIFEKLRKNWRHGRNHFNLFDSGRYNHASATSTFCFFHSSISFFASTSSICSVWFYCFLLWIHTSNSRAIIATINHAVTICRILRCINWLPICSSIWLCDSCRLSLLSPQMTLTFDNISSLSVRFGSVLVLSNCLQSIWQQLLLFQQKLLHQRISRTYILFASWVSRFLVLV